MSGGVNEWIGSEYLWQGINIRQQKKLPLKGIQTAVDNALSSFRQQILLKFVMTVVRELKQDSISDPKTPKQQCVSCFKKVQGDKDMGRNDRQCQLNHHHSTSKTQPNQISSWGFCAFLLHLHPPLTWVWSAPDSSSRVLISINKKKTLNRVRKYNCFI